MPHDLEIAFLIAGLSYLQSPSQQRQLLVALRLKRKASKIDERFVDIVRRKRSQGFECRFHNAIAITLELDVRNTNFLSQS